MTSLANIDAAGAKAPWHLTPAAIMPPPPPLPSLSYVRERRPDSSVTRGHTCYGEESFTPMTSSPLGAVLPTSGSRLILTASYSDISSGILISTWA